MPALEQPSIDLSAPRHPYRLDWTGNHFLPPHVVADAVREATQRINFTTKGDPFAADLCARIAASLGVSEDHVAVGPGSAFVLDALLRAHPDSEIVDVVPNFRGARIVAQRDKRAYRSVPIRPGERLPAALERVLESQGRPQLVILSSPRNPFGSSVNADDISSLLSMYSGPLIVDECYADFASSSLVALTLSEPRLLVIRTFSKAWGLANLRLGFVVSGGLPDKFRQNYLLKYAVGDLQRLVGEAMLTKYAGQVELSIAETKRERAHIAAALARLPDTRVFDSDANYLCFENPNAPAVSAALRARGFRAVRLHEIAGYRETWPDGLRLSVVPRQLFARVQAAMSQ